MKKRLLYFIPILISINLYAYTDNDMDGVDDAIDKCPNTLLTELADVHGCPIESLVSPHRYDVIVGVNYSDSDYRTLNTTDTFATSLQLDYYYKQFSIQASTSYFTTEGTDYEDSGLYDSFIGASYSLNKIDNLSISLSVGVILPTYDAVLDNNNMDYTASVNLSYAINNINIFGGYAFTLINDDDVDWVDADGNDNNTNYQNTNSFSGGLGYYLNNKLYMSASYSSSDSIYKNVEDIQTANIYGYYTINKDMFTTVAYSYGISDSASNNYLSIRLGFLF